MNLRRTIVPALLATLISTGNALVPPQAGQGAPTTKLSAPGEFVLTPYAGLLRTVVVKSGAYEAPFLFDTGGGCTVLSLAAAKALALTPFGRATGFRHDGGRVDGPRAGPVELALGTFTRRGEVGVLDTDALLAGLPPVGGIVSLETFAGRALTVDLAHERLFLESAETLRERVKGASELAVRIGHQSAGAALDLFVAVEGEHGWLWFELDCGNLAPVLLAPHAFVELGLEPLAVGKNGKVELPIVGLGLVPCEVQCKELIYDGLLNAAFFARHAISIDLAAVRAWARANP